MGGSKRFVSLSTRMLMLGGPRSPFHIGTVVRSSAQRRVCVGPQETGLPAEDKAHSLQLLRGGGTLDGPRAFQKMTASFHVAS